MKLHEHDPFECFLAVWIIGLTAPWGLLVLYLIYRWLTVLGGD